MGASPWPASGAAERQGIVHRLDVGTSGLMVVAAAERAYTERQARLQGTHGRQDFTTLVQGLPDPARHD